MRVQLASPELHKRLRFLSSRSIKERKQEIPESHWLKPRLFTTALLLLCPIQTYTNPDNPCVTTFDLWTPQHTQAMLADRDGRFYSLLKPSGSSPAQRSSTGVTDWKIKDGGGLWWKSGIKSSLSLRGESVNCVQVKWGSFKRLKGDLWTGLLPHAFVLTLHGGTGVTLNTDARAKHIWWGRICDRRFNQHLLHFWIICWNFVDTSGQSV